MGNCLGSERRPEDPKIRSHLRLEQSSSEAPSSSSRSIISNAFRELSLTERYPLDESKVIGKGADALVLRSEDITTNTPVAIKVIVFEEGKRQKELEKRFQQEVAVLSSLQHPSIVQLYDFHREASRGLLVLEFAEGGDLLDVLMERSRLSEWEAARILLNLVDAVLFMHSQNIVHRDLKPENILLRKRGFLQDLLITDFGFACHCSEDSLTEVLGTVNYMAPEALMGGPYGRAVDVWALGIILFVSLSGSFPFLHADRQQLVRAIVHGHFSFYANRHIWDSISVRAKDLIRHILVVDPQQRYSLEQIAHHPWVASHRQNDNPL